MMENGWAHQPLIRGSGNKIGWLASETWAPGDSMGTSLEAERFQPVSEESLCLLAEVSQSLLVFLSAWKHFSPVGWIKACWAFSSGRRCLLEAQILLGEEFLLQNLFYFLDAGTRRFSFGCWCWCHYQSPPNGHEVGPHGEELWAVVLLVSSSSCPF